MYSVKEIAEKAKISTNSVRKRLKNIAPVAIIAKNGRPAMYYDDSVLALFPQLPEYVWGNLSIKTRIREDQLNKLMLSNQNHITVTTIVYNPNEKHFCEQESNNIKTIESALYYVFKKIDSGCKKIILIDNFPVES